MYGEIVVAAVPEPVLVVPVMPVVLEAIVIDAAVGNTVLLGPPAS